MRALCPGQDVRALCANLKNVLAICREEEFDEWVVDDVARSAYVLGEQETQIPQIKCVVCLTPCSLIYHSLIYQSL